MKSLPSATTSHLVHAPGGRKSRASRALSTRPAQTCSRVNFRSPPGFTGTVAVEKIMIASDGVSDSLGGAWSPPQGDKASFLPQRPERAAPGEDLVEHRVDRL